MGRNRKTTDQLDRAGAFDKNPARGRARGAEPIVRSELGAPPPEFLNPHSPTSLELKRAWDELLFEAKDVRLTSADRSLFISTCRLKVRTARLSAKTGDFAQLLAHLGKLGLTPTDRSRVQGVGQSTPEEKKEGWAAIAAGGNGLPVQ